MTDIHIKDLQVVGVSKPEIISTSTNTEHIHAAMRRAQLLSHKFELRCNIEGWERWVINQMFQQHWPGKAFRLDENLEANFLVFADWARDNSVMLVYSSDDPDEDKSLAGHIVRRVKLIREAGEVLAKVQEAIEAGERI